MSVNEKDQASLKESLKHLLSLTKDRSYTIKDEVKADDKFYKQIPYVPLHRWVKSSVKSKPVAAESKIPKIVEKTEAHSKSKSESKSKPAEPAVTAIKKPAFKIKLKTLKKKSLTVKPKRPSPPPKKVPVKLTSELQIKLPIVDIKDLQSDFKLFDNSFKRKSVTFAEHKNVEIDHQDYNTRCTDDKGDVSSTDTPTKSILKASEDSILVSDEDDSQGRSLSPKKKVELFPGRKSNRLSLKSHTKSDPKKVRRNTKIKSNEKNSNAEKLPKKKSSQLKITHFTRPVLKTVGTQTPTLRFFRQRRKALKAHKLVMVVSESSTDDDVEVKQKGGQYLNSNDWEDVDDDIENKSGEEEKKDTSSSEEKDSDEMEVNEADDPESTKTNATEESTKAVVSGSEESQAESEQGDKKNINEAEEVSDTDSCKQGAAKSVSSNEDDHQEKEDDKIDENVVDISDEEDNANSNTETTEKTNEEKDDENLSSPIKLIIDDDEKEKEVEESSPKKNGNNDLQEISDSELLNERKSPHSNEDDNEDEITLTLKDSDEASESDTHKESNNSEHSDNDNIKKINEETDAQIALQKRKRNRIISCSDSDSGKQSINGNNEASDSEVKKLSLKRKAHGNSDQETNLKKRVDIDLSSDDDNESGKKNTSFSMRVTKQSPPESATSVNKTRLRSKTPRVRVTSSSSSTESNGKSVLNTIVELCDTDSEPEVAKPVEDVSDEGDSVLQISNDEEKDTAESVVPVEENTEKDDAEVVPDSGVLAGLSNDLNTISDQLFELFNQSAEIEKAALVEKNEKETTEAAKNSSKPATKEKRNPSVDSVLDISLSAVTSTPIQKKKIVEENEEDSTLDETLTCTLEESNETVVNNVTSLEKPVKKRKPGPKSKRRKLDETEKFHGDSSQPIVEAEKEENLTKSSLEGEKGNDTDKTSDVSMNTEESVKKEKSPKKLKPGPKCSKRRSKSSSISEITPATEPINIPDNSNNEEEPLNDNELASESIVDKVETVNEELPMSKKKSKAGPKSRKRKIESSDEEVPPTKTALTDNKKITNVTVKKLSLSSNEINSIIYKYTQDKSICGFTDSESEIGEPKETNEEDVVNVDDDTKINETQNKIVGLVDIVEHALASIDKAPLVGSPNRIEITKENASPQTCEQILTNDEKSSAQKNDTDVEEIDTDGQTTEIADSVSDDDEMETYEILDEINSCD